MKALYFDCFSGISGDMTLGALLDLGLDERWLANQLETLNVDGWKFSVTKTVKNGITANHAIVEQHEHKHEHIHGHTHVHKHEHEHRSFGDIVKIIDASGITTGAKFLAKAIFQRIADAEAKVHGSTPEEVHFHEVGAVDSIIDIVGTAILIDHINPDKVYSSVVNNGYGFTHCQHGKIPIPAPAVTEIFADPKVRSKQINIENELTTPTGAAIIAELAESFGPMPEMKIVKTGYGAGTRDLEIPNVLRVYLCEVEETVAMADFSSEIFVVEANIDDCSPEILAYTMERLLSEGANDVFFSPVQMKKNRPAAKLTVLCERERLKLMADIIFAETTTIGLRVREEKRICLQRETQVIPTKFGNISVKKTSYKSGEHLSPEYESAKSLALLNNVPLRDIYEEVKQVSN